MPVAERVARLFEQRQRLRVGRHAELAEAAVADRGAREQVLAFDPACQLRRLGERGAAVLAISVGPALLSERDQELDAARLVRLRVAQRFERTLVLARALGVGEPFVRHFGSGGAGAHGLVGRSARKRLEVVVGELGGRRRGAPRQRLGHAAVERHALRDGQLLVERLAHQRVGEAEAPRRLRVGQHDARLGGLGERLERALDAARLGQHASRELAPDRGGGAQQRIRVRGERIEAAADGIAYTLRQREGERSAGAESATVAQPARHLLHEEGIALGELGERLRERGVELCSRNRLRERRGLAGREAAQRHARHLRLACEVAEHASERVTTAHLDVAIGPDQQQRRVAQLAREEEEQAQRVADRPSAGRRR